MNLLVFLFQMAMTHCSGKELHLLSITGANLDIDVDHVDACIGSRIISCKLVLVNLEAFTGNVILPGGQILTKIREWISGDLTTLKYIGHDNYVIFVKRNGRVMGAIGEFVLEPCDNFDGCHVWKKMDVWDPLEEDRTNVLGRKRRITRRQSDTTTISTFSVKFYYTRQFIQHTSDVGLFFDFLVAGTNDGYYNSGIPIRMVKHCVEEAALDDEFDTDTMLSKFNNYKHEHDYVFGYPWLRDTADAAILLAYNMEHFGLAVLNGARVSWTTAVVAKEGAQSYFTVGHEIGHMLGAQHDDGKFFDGFRTIMKNGIGRRVNYYSNPNVIDRWTGTPTGSPSLNSAQIIRDNRFEISDIGDETSTCAPSWPRWPEDFKWSSSGTVLDRCLQITEPAEPSRTHWHDNFFCWRGNVDLGFYWSTTGYRCGMRCTHIWEGADPHGWHDNFLCVPATSPLYLSWGSAGRNKDRDCIRWSESSDPATWHDNWLCAEGGTTNPSMAVTSWPTWPDDFAWSSSGPVLDTCINIHNWREPTSHTWWDNWFCWKNGKTMKMIWSYGCFPWYWPYRCTPITEGSDPHYWGSNNLCVHTDSPYHFVWSSAGPINGKQCIQWIEGSDPHTWNDNYLCA